MGFDAVAADFNHCLFGLVQILLVKTDNIAMIVHTDQNHAAAGVGKSGYLVGKAVSARQLSLNSMVESSPRWIFWMRSERLSNMIQFKYRAGGVD